MNLPLSREIYLEGIYFGNKLSLFFLAHSQVEAARFLDVFFGYLRKIEFP